LVALFGLGLVHLLSDAGQLLGDAAPLFLLGLMQRALEALPSICSSHRGQRLVPGRRSSLHPVARIRLVIPDSRGADHALPNRRLMPLLLTAGALLIPQGPGRRAEVTVACPSGVTDPSSGRTAALEYWTSFEGAPEDGVALAPDDE